MKNGIKDIQAMAYDGSRAVYVSVALPKWPIKQFEPIGKNIGNRY